jgi:hypothetical protein
MFLVVQERKIEDAEGSAALNCKTIEKHGPREYLRLHRYRDFLCCFFAGHRITPLIAASIPSDPILTTIKFGQSSHLPKSATHLAVSLSPKVPNRKWNGVADGTRTRNSQNHNLELYH